MNRTPCALVIGFLVATAVPGLAQDPVWYEVDFVNAAHHEARITVTFPDLEEGTLELRLSRSSPGRYALHEFGKNVYDVVVMDGMERALEVTRPDPYQWNVTHPTGDVKVSYTLFADRGDGTYTGIDRAQAHLNVPATFMWARGLEFRPVRVDFRPPDGSGWSVATQLHPGDRAYSFNAPDLQYFMDSPTHLGNLDVREWTDGEYTFRVAVDHDGAEREVTAFSADVRSIVEATRDIWGGYPAFDYGTYTFIAAYLPWMGGDGMEHRNSTSLTSTGTIRENSMGLLGTAAHEFFHAWNVERLRPASLEPFDFERANMSGELWFAEGFTSYYTNVILRRAGLIDTEDLARRLGGGISTVMNSPGRRFRSPVEMSRFAPFVDRAVSVDPNNRPNTFISYYTWGSVVGLALDLELRHRFAGAGLSLDAYMRGAWQAFGRSETPYTVADLEGVLAGLSGDEVWAREFFDLYVRGRQVPDFGPLLAHAGLRLQPRNPGLAWVGPVQLEAGEGGAVLRSYTIQGTPLYEAGIDRGDRIVSIDGQPVSSSADLERALSTLEPRDQVEVAFWSRGSDLRTTLTVAEDPAVEVVTYEAVGAPLTPAIAELRGLWLGGS